VRELIDIESMKIMIRIKCRASAGETAAPARQYSARAANRSTILWAITGADALHAPGFEKFVAGNFVVMDQGAIGGAETAWTIRRYTPSVGSVSPDFQRVNVDGAMPTMRQSSRVVSPRFRASCSTSVAERSMFMRSRYAQ